MADYWILEGHQPVKASLLQWAQWFETADRHVGLTDTKRHRISTTYLGLDMGFGQGPPQLFETMVFANDGEGDLDGEQWRYSTWDDAEAGHKATVRRIERLEQASDSLAADLSATTGR